MAAPAGLCRRRSGSFSRLPWSRRRPFSVSLGEVVRPLSAPAADLVRETEPQAGYAVKPRGVVPPIPIPEIERRILDALEKPFPATERGAEKPTFRDAVARMAKLLPVPVDFDTKHLEDASIDLAIEVELPQGNRTIGSVLEAVLSSAPQPLVWTAHNEALTITTAEASRPNAGHAGLRRDRSRRRCCDPRGVKWSDAAPLVDIVRKSVPRRVISVGRGECRRAGVDRGQLEPKGAPRIWRPS